MLHEFVIFPMLYKSHLEKNKIFEVPHYAVFSKIMLVPAC
jgi:hypothetical protein